MSAELCPPKEVIANPDKKIKLFLIGKQGSGKTSMIFRFTLDEDCPPPGSIGSPEVFHRCMKVGAQDIQLDIWDTTGQERFMHVMPYIYRDLHGVMLVFDVTSQDSFDRIPQWLRELKANAPSDVSIILVGNKNDCSSRAVEYSVAERFAEENGMEYIETNARSIQSVNDAFLLLASKILANTNENELL